MDTQHGEMSDEKKMWKMKWREHMAMRALTAVIVLIFVFWCGFQFGEIRASVGLSHSGYGMMRGGWGGGMGHAGMRGVMIPQAGSNTTVTVPTQGSSGN